MGEEQAQHARKIGTEWKKLKKRDVDVSGNNADLQSVFESLRSFEIVRTTRRSRI